MREIQEKSNHRFNIYESQVRKYFRFLEKDFEFKYLDPEIIMNRYIHLRYISKKVYVDFYYGAPGYELDFSIGRLNADSLSEKRHFGSSEVMFLDDTQDPEDYKIYSAFSIENIYKCIPKLAKVLKENGRDLLQGNASTFKQIKSKSEKIISKWNKEEELNQIKKLGQIAWDQRNYTKLIKLFDPIHQNLKPSEQKKLMLAKKKLHLKNE